MLSRGDFRVGVATAEDVEVLLSLIKELAAYERMSDEVVATEDDIRRSLFSESPHAEALIARVGAQTVGFAIFFQTFSTFLGKPGLYLEDLFVRPEARGRGYGRRILAELARIAVRRHCGRMEWSVLDWNELAMATYRRVGAAPMNQWTTWRLSGRKLEAFAGEEHSIRR
jgi:GNAT superfamily N-acetyltransferase